MPRTIQAPDPPDEPPKRKERRIEVRVEPELEERARKKAERHGWTLSSVLRSLLSLWADEDVISPDDVGKHAARAPKPKRKQK